MDTFSQSSSATSVSLSSFDDRATINTRERVRKVSEDKKIQDKASSKEGQSTTAPITEIEDIDLDTIESEKDLLGFGMERLKYALQKRCLKCGGTINERAKRLFSVKGKTADEYPD